MQLSVPQKHLGPRSFFVCTLSINLLLILSIDMYVPALPSMQRAFDVSAALVALAGVAVLYAYLFLFTDRDMAALSVVIAQSDRFEEACELIARTAKLSKREAEILPLALRGRTAERIAGEFFISKNPVDTHLRRIYAKCGVHTRQELIDLFD